MAIPAQTNAQAISQMLTLVKTTIAALPRAVIASADGWSR